MVWSLSLSFTFIPETMSATVLEERRATTSISEKDATSSSSREDLDSFTPEEEEYFKSQFYGVQKVILMKRLGAKWDKFLVVTG